MSQIFFCLLPGVNGYGSVCHEPFPITNFLIIYFCWGEEVPTSVLGSQPIIWLLSSSSWCPATWVRSPSTNIWSPLCDLHSFLTVTLWRLDTINSNTRSSNFISLLPVGYHVTWYIQMPTWDTGSVSLDSEKIWSVMGVPATGWSQGPQWASSWVPLAKKQKKC